MSAPNSTCPFKVYSQRKASLSEPTPFHSPSTGPTNVEVISLPTNDIPEHDDLDIPIVLHKGTRNCTKHPLSSFISYDPLSPNHQAFVANLNAIPIPKTAPEALQNENWINAMKIEMEALKKNKTWDLVKLPKVKKPVGCRWVFTLKYNSDGTLERYKAQLVAKGYTQSQTYSVGNVETFAPIPKINSVRVLLSIATNFGLKITTA